MPTSTATQSPEGRWLLKVKHDIDRPTLKVPVVLVYDGHSAIDDDDTPITVTNTYPVNPVITQWKTPLGQAIDTSKITIKKPYPQVIDGYNIYEVTGITWDEVQPYTAETYELMLTPTPPQIGWNERAEITAIYRRVDGGTDKNDTNVTTGTTFTITSDPGNTVRLVSEGDRRYLVANTATTSVMPAARQVTVKGSYAGEIEGETIVEVLNKTQSDTPEDPEEGGGGGASGDTPTAAPEPVGITSWGGTGLLNAVNDTTYWNVKILPNDLTKDQKRPVIKIQDTSLGLDYRLSWNSKDGGYYEVEFRTSDASNIPEKTGTTVVSAMTKDGKYFTTTTIKILEAGTYITSLSRSSVTIPKPGTVYSASTFDITANFRFEIGCNSKVLYRDISAITRSMLDTTVEVEGGKKYFSRQVWNGEATGGTTTPLASFYKNTVITARTITAVNKDAEGTITGGTMNFRLAVHDNLGDGRSYNVIIKGLGNGDKGKSFKVTQNGTSSFVDEVSTLSGYCESSGEFRWEDPSRPKQWMEISPYMDENNQPLLGYFTVTLNPSEIDTVKNKTRVSDSWLSIVDWEETGKSGKPEGSKEYRVVVKAQKNTTGSRRDTTITFNTHAASAEKSLVEKTVCVRQGA